MITRLLIENYRCFERVVLEPSSLTLLMGHNGAGKSTVFEALHNIRQLVTGQGDAHELFPPTTLTRWGKQKTQSFRLDVAGPKQETYSYRLAIRQGSASTRIEREEILLGERTLYSFTKEEVVLFYPDHKQHFPAGSRRSPLANIPEKLRSKQLSWIIDRLSGIWVFKPIPQTLASTASLGPGSPHHPDLSPDLSNFVLWLLHIHKTHPNSERKLKRRLKDVLEGFFDYRFVRLGGDLFRLRFWFRSPSKSRSKIYLDFNELSEGQRALTILYALLSGKADGESTLCLDEPVNFLSPREIQPWLNLLMEEAESGTQALLISHNPGLIDFLASERGLLLKRAGGGPARIQRILPNGSSLPVSELIARGWLHE